MHSNKIPVDLISQGCSAHVKRDGELCHPNRHTTRSEREEQQRFFAKKRYSELRRLLPKRVREREVRRDRAFKHGVDSTEAEFQSWQHVAGAAAGVAATHLTRVAARGVRTLFAKLNKIADNTDETITSTNELVKLVMDQLRSIGATVSKAVGAMYYIVIFLAAYWCHQRLGTNFVAQTVLTTAVATLIGKGMWSVVRGEFALVQAQSSFGGIAAAIAGLLCFTHLPGDASKFVPEILRRVGTFPRAITGFEALLEAAFSFVEKVVNVVARMLGKDAIHFGDAMTRQIKMWTSEAEKIDAEMVALKDDNPEPAFIRRVFEKIQEGYSLKHTVNDERLKVMMQRALDKLEARLKPYETQLMAAKTYRVEPEFLMLYGKSAQGKTTLITRVAQALLILSGLCEPKDAMSNMWQKGDSKYFESYCGQKCMVMDDVFQEKVVPGSDGNEFMQIIRMIGNWSYPLNMASVDLKAKFFFTSPIVIGTTNLSSVHQTTAAQVIFAPEALARRVKRCLKIEAAPEYSTEAGELDYAKFEAESRRRIALINDLKKSGKTLTKTEVLSAFPWDAWRATKWDWSTGQSLTEEVDLIDYITDMAGSIRTKIRMHDESAAGIDHYNTLLADAVDDGCVPQAGFDLNSIYATGEECGADWAYPPVADFEELKRREMNARENLRADISAAGSTRYIYLADDQVESAYRHAMLEIHPDKGGNVQVAQYINERYDIWKNLHDATIKYSNERLRILENAKRFLKSLWESFKVSPLQTAINFSLSALTWASVAACIIQFLHFMCKAVIAVAMSIVGFICRLFGVSSVRSESNITSSKPSPKQENVFKKAVVSHSFDGSQMEVKQNIVYENTYKLMYSSVAIGQVLFLRGYIAVMPRHYLNDIRTKVSSGDKVTLVSVTNGQNTFDILKDDFLSMDMIEVPESDLVFVKFRADGFQARRDIVKHLLSSDHLMSMLKDAHRVRLDVCDARLNEANGTYQMSRVVMQAPKVTLYSELAVSDLKIQNLMGYDMDTRIGMCGAPLMLCEPKYFGGKCLVGIHVAGTNRVFNRKGFSSPISSELAEDAISKLGAVKDLFEEDMEARGIVLTVPDEDTKNVLAESGLIAGSFELLYEVDRPWNLAPNTKLKQSFVGEQEMLGPYDAKPAHLRPIAIDGVKHYPMIEGLRNYQSKVESVNVNGLDFYVQLATWKFRQETLYEKRRIFTFEEAVKGVEGLKIKAINRATSPGFPYVYDCAKGKTAFFGEDGDYQFTSAECVELEKRVEYIIDQARQGNRCGHVCIDFLKDELRPSAKVDTCQTRIISGSPVDYVLAVRRMFGAFIAASFRHHTKTGLCPGINPYSDWWELANHLKGSKRTKVFDGDFKRFDASEQPAVHWEILEFINLWYNDGHENALIRRVLWLDLVHSRHLTGVFGNAKYIVQWSKSLPSGHPLTTIVNSWYAMITITVCYGELTGRPQSMWDNIGPAVFGDDNIIGVDDSVSEVFNQVTVASKMKECFNLTFTSGSKDGTLQPYRTLEECTFLKRGFLPDNSPVSHGWAAPLDKNSFLYTSYYFKNARTFNDEMVTKLNGTLGEMCLHAESVWDEHAPKVMNILRESFNTEPMFQTREQYRQATSMMTDFWF